MYTKEVYMKKFRIIHYAILILLLLVSSLLSFSPAKTLAATITNQQQFQTFAQRLNGVRLFISAWSSPPPFIYIGVLPVPLIASTLSDLINTAPARYVDASLNPTDPTKVAQFKSLLASLGSTPPGFQLPQSIWGLTLDTLQSLVDGASPPSGVPSPVPSPSVLPSPAPSPQPPAAPAPGGAVIQQQAAGGGSTNCSAIPNNQARAKIICVLRNVSTWALGFLVVIAVAVVVFAAFTYLSGGSSAEKVKTANKMLLFAAIGLGVGLLAKVLVLLVSEIVGASGPAPVEFGDVNTFLIQ